MKRIVLICLLLLLAVSIFGFTSCKANETIQAQPPQLDHFDISTIAPQTTGESFSIAITAKDGNENTFTSFNEEISLSDSSGTIAPTMTMSFSEGKLTSSVRINTLHKSNKITASFFGKSGSSNSFDVRPAGTSWRFAKFFDGKNLTVYGPVKSTNWATTSRGQPTFINVGNAYPDPNRFQVVIWVQYRSNFPGAPENIYSNKTVYVTGTIKLYEGVPEMVITSPSQIQVW
jgi:hypothetical protein